MKYVHTMIDRPTEIRRALLQSAVSAAEMLRNYENLKDLSSSKQEIKKRLKLNIARMKRMANDARKSLPIIPKELEKPVQIRPIPMRGRDEPLNLSSRERIDKELRDIKNKISRLRI
ncbi:MAG TPA: hypothetical protein VJB94_02360 [Candidatus Nanoarchaeia archaeon]|nr:hypothetical protein [Candidatus Nanoarchaeia archaeon]